MDEDDIDEVIVAIVAGIRDRAAIEAERGRDFVAELLRAVAERLERS